MKKLDNKGFAITTIIYGMLILFMFLLLSVLGMLSGYLKNINILMDSVDGVRESATIEPICVVGSPLEMRNTYTVNGEYNREKCLQIFQSGLYCFDSTSVYECSRNCYYVSRKVMCD